VEFVLALPDRARSKGGIAKALLAEAVKDLLPAQSLGQPKRTFTLPWEVWLRGPVASKLQESFAEPAPALRPFLHQDGLRAVWNDFLAGRTSWSRPWALFVLNEWCRHYLAR